MKQIFSLIICILILLFPVCSFCQEIKSEISKSEIVVGDEVEISFMMDEKTDSASRLRFENFIILNGPQVSSSFSIDNGKISNSYKVTYKLKAAKSGSEKIACPVFYSENNRFQGQAISTNVTGANLSAEQLYAFRQSTLKDAAYKSVGTYRYVVKDDLGLVEIMTNSGWEFHRYLSKKEIKTISKIK